MFLNRNNIEKKLKQGSNFIFLDNARVDDNNRKIYSNLKLLNYTTYNLFTILLESMGQTAELFIRNRSSNKNSEIKIVSIKEVKGLKNLDKIKYNSYLKIEAKIEIISEFYCSSLIVIYMDSKQIISAYFIHHILHLK